MKRADHFRRRPCHSKAITGTAPLGLFLRSLVTSWKPSAFVFSHRHVDKQPFGITQHRAFHKADGVRADEFGFQGGRHPDAARQRQAAA